MFEMPYKDYNEIEQQTDVCFLIADVYNHSMLLYANRKKIEKIERKRTF